MQVTASTRIGFLLKRYPGVEKLFHWYGLEIEELVKEDNLRELSWEHRIDLDELIDDLQAVVAEDSKGKDIDPDETGENYDPDEEDEIQPITAAEEEPAAAEEEWEEPGEEDDEVAASGEDDEEEEGEGGDFDDEDEDEGD
jgi:hypothetical protein